MSTKQSTAVATTHPKSAADLVNELAKLGYDVTDMTEAEVAEFAETLEYSAQNTMEGVDLKPTAIKINKDLAKFTDPANMVYDSLAGVVVLKQKARAFWPKGTTGRPECRSFDCITGHYKTDPNDENEDGKPRACATCPHGQWGSGVNERGEATRGRACKETRRIFLNQGAASVPVLISLPPTSIGVWDAFINARATQRISDLQVGVKLSLENAKGAGFSYAKLRVENGERVLPREIVRLGTIARTMKALASRFEMEMDEGEDGGGSDFSGNPAPSGTVDETNALADD